MNKYVPQFEPFNKDSKLDVIGILLLSFMSISIIYGVTKASDDGTFFTLKPMIYIIMGILLTITYCIYNRQDIIIQFYQSIYLHKRNMLRHLLDCYLPI